MGLFSGTYLNLPKLFENPVNFFLSHFYSSIELLCYRSFTVSICGLWMNLQWNLDLVTLNLVTTCDLMTILQRYSSINYIKSFDLVTLCNVVTIFAETKSRLHCITFVEALLWECRGGIVLCCWEVVSCFLCWVR